MGEAEHRGSNERECFRIEYPDNNHPFLDVGGRSFEVVNISEKGVRVRYDSDGKGFPVDAGVLGVINMRCGDVVEVEGEVLRHVEDGFVVLFSIQPIPLASIINEQRYFARKYKHRVL